MTPWTLPMRFVTQIPAPPLDRYVELLWFYDDLEVGHRRERVLPVGTFELIVNLEARPRVLFPREPGGRESAFRRAWISGAHSEAIEIDALPGASLMGAHFRPGGAAAILGTPATEWSERVVEFEEFWGSAVVALRDRLLEEPTPGRKLGVLECWLASRVGAPRDQAMSYAVERWGRDPHMARIDEVAQELGLSHKHLITRFAREVGLTPKRFCRIMRFRRVLSEIEARRPVGWADLAAACGYYDQSHFIQEFRGFSGMNPGAYLRSRGEYLGHVPLR